MNEIKRIRKRLMMNQAEMGAACGVHGSNISRWECFGAPVWGGWRVLRLARANRIGTTLEKILPDPESAETDI